MTRYCHLLNGQRVFKISPSTRRRHVPSRAQGLYLLRVPNGPRIPKSKLRDAPEDVSFLLSIDRFMDTAARSASENLSPQCIAHPRLTNSAWKTPTSLVRWNKKMGGWRVATVLRGTQALAPDSTGTIYARPQPDAHIKPGTRTSHRRVKNR